MSVGNTWWACTRSRQITCKIEFPFVFNFASERLRCVWNSEETTNLPPSYADWHWNLIFSSLYMSSRQTSLTNRLYLFYFPGALVYQRHSLSVDRKGQVINYKVKHMQIKFEQQPCLFQSHQSISQSFLWISWNMSTFFSLQLHFAFLCARMDEVLLQTGVYAAGNTFTVVLAYKETPRNDH